MDTCLSKRGAPSARKGKKENRNKAGEINSAKLPYRERREDPPDSTGGPVRQTSTLKKHQKELVRDNPS